MERGLVYPDTKKSSFFTSFQQGKSKGSSSSSSTRSPSTAFISGPGAKGRSRTETDREATAASTTNRKLVTSSSTSFPKKNQALAYVAPSSFPTAALLAARNIATRPLPSPPKRSSQPQLNSRAKYPGPTSSQTSVSNGRGTTGPKTKSSSGSTIKTKYESSSDSEDELSLGSTPIQHQHQAYREGSRDIESPIPRSQSRKSATHDQNNYTKRKEGRILIPASSDDLLDTPRQRENHICRPTNHRDQKKNRDSDGSTSGPDVKPFKKRAGHGKMNKNSTITDDDYEEEDTPRPKGKDNGASRDRSNDKRDGERSSSPSRRTSGARFFAQLSKYSSDNEVDYDLLNADASEVIEQPPELDHDDLSVEDNAYLASFKNKDNLCPYCSEAMPMEPSDHLKRLQAKLEAISIPRPTASNPAARQLSWQQSVVFCSLHRAEAIVIPLGIRDGFPKDIDFTHMQDRLEKGWIRDYLDELTKDPHKSKVFQGVIGEIKEIGKLQWGGIHHQSNEDMLQAVMPGYYGELGRTIIVDHFILLLRWGYLPALKATENGGNPYVIDPLTTKDFFSHVLVPEAGILLIMSDQGSEKYTEKAYIEAERIKGKSVTYGRWNFREDDERGKRILSELHDLKGKEEKKERLREIKREKKGEREGRKGKKVKVNKYDDDKENGDLQRENTTSTDSIIILDSAPLPSRTSTSPTELNRDGNGRKRKATTPLEPTFSQTSNHESEGESIWGEDLSEELLKTIEY